MNAEHGHQEQLPLPFVPKAPGMLERIEKVEEKERYIHMAKTVFKDLSFIVQAMLARVMEKVLDGLDHGECDVIVHITNHHISWTKIRKRTGEPEPMPWDVK